jgi:hypothetical protein
MGDRARFEAAKRPVPGWMRDKDRRNFATESRVHASDKKKCAEMPVKAVRRRTRVFFPGANAVA